MQTNVARAAVVALLTVSLGVAAQAAPSFRSPLKKAVQALQGGIEEQANKPYQWMLPSVIQAGLVPREASAFLGESYASFHGRSFQMLTDQGSIGVTDYLQLMYGNQYVLAKGRHTSSRFDVADNYFGIRGVVKKPTAKDPSALSLQFEALKPDTGSARIGTSSAEFSGTHNNIYSVNYQDRVANLYQVQYTSVDVPGGLNAHVYSLAFGRDYRLDDTFLARVQASLVNETYQAIGTSSNYEMRPILYGCIAATPTDNLSIEFDITAYPAGVPLAGGDVTAVSSFDLYSPGGIVTDLRTEFAAFASLRILYHVKF